MQSTNLQESLFNCTSAINYETMNYVINYEERVCLFVFGATVPSGPGPPHSRGFLDHTQRRTTVGRTPLDE